MAPDWSFATLFLVKDSLAVMLEAAGLLEDALREYTELEAVYLETIAEAIGMQDGCDGQCEHHGRHRSQGTAERRIGLAHGDVARRAAGDHARRRHGRAAVPAVLFRQAGGAAAAAPPPRQRGRPGPRVCAGLWVAARRPHGAAQRLSRGVDLWGVRGARRCSRGRSAGRRRPREQQRGGGRRWQQRRGL